MADTLTAEAQVKLVKDLQGEQKICALLSELLGEIAERGIREGCFSLEDAIGAASRVAKLLYWSILETERIVATDN